MNIKRLLRAGSRYLVDADYRVMIHAGRGKYDRLTDAAYIRKIFRAKMGYEIDLDNPQTFNEKLQWLKLHNRRPEYTMMADKFSVRDYVAKQLGEEYLIPLLGVWENPDEIDFDALPNQFVLKCNHNSGLGMCICKDKSTLNIEKVKAELRKGLAQDYYLCGREWPYKNVPRKIIAEKYMEEEDGSDLRDYKIHCFHGEPQFILVCSDRFADGGLREDFYDTSWKRMDLRRPQHPNSAQGTPRPEKLEQMLEKARILAKSIPFARIDFYVINQKIYFGEITFFPASGFEKFEPEEADRKLGAMLKLP